MDRKIKFGVCADLHVSGAPYAERFLREFLDACKKENVDFILAVD